MTAGDDWDALSGAWQAQPVDTAALRDAVRRRGRRLRWLMWLDVASVLVAIAFGIGLLVHSAAIWPRAGGVLVVVVIVGGALVQHRSRRGLWRAASNSVADLLRLQRARCVNAVRTALWGLPSAPLGMLIGVLVTQESRGWPSGTKLAAMGLASVAICLGVAWYVRGQRRRIAAIDTLLEQLER